MGCTICVCAETQEPTCSETNVVSPLSYPVPFGHVPYTPALPGAMGPLWSFPIEWWYYAGWAHDQSGSKTFSILVQIIRYGPGGAILYGIGTTSDAGSNQPPFESQWSGGLGSFPSPTSASWSIETKTNKQMTMTCTLMSGTLGLSGATYKLDMTDVTHGVSASFALRDTFGMILEGASGAFKGGENDSYEFAMPSLSIQEGTITMHGETTPLKSGNLWLDRQCINQPSLHGHSASPTTPIPSSDSSQHQLYTGNWLAVIMNDQTRYVLVFFWPKKQHQWIVGTELQPPVPPEGKIGLEYPPLSDWDLSSPVQGVHVLDSSEFDLNILHPNDPPTSPHWTSPTSHQTYCSAWKLRIRKNVYTMTVLIPESEVHASSTYFFEGAAIICDEHSNQVGRSFVEQMGYTQEH